MTDQINQSDASSDVRPLVASAKSNLGVWMFGGALIVAGVMLFQTLENRRASGEVSSISRPAKDGAQISAPPDLDVPADPSAEDRYNPDARFLPPKFAQPQSVSQSLPTSSRGPELNNGKARQLPRQSDAPAGLGSLPDYPRAAPFPPPGTSLPSARPTTAVDLLNEQEKAKERVVATRFTNPATTVPKGTVMQAVLETALDSSRPGFARAVISRDVTGFDGSQVLVPRGSRLIGEYKSDLAAGQRRALIQWQRLMRPDGVLINLDSPSADPLGRAGIGGKVNTHFFERFAGSILQSTLDIGVQLATRRLSRDTYILALPGSTQGLIANGAEKIPPTVTVRQGASVSVFVARDLDFTLAGQ